MTGWLLGTCDMSHQMHMSHDSHDSHDWVGFMKSPNSPSTHEQALETGDWKIMWLDSRAMLSAQTVRHALRVIFLLISTAPLDFSKASLASSLASCFCSFTLLAAKRFPDNIWRSPSTATISSLVVGFLMNLIPRPFRYLRLSAWVRNFFEVRWWLAR